VTIDDVIAFFFFARPSSKKVRVAVAITFLSFTTPPQKKMTIIAGVPSSSLQEHHRRKMLGLKRGTEKSLGKGIVCVFGSSPK